MTAPTELVVPNLTAAEFKAKIIGFIKSSDCKAELLLQVLSSLPDDKLALFEEYRANSTTDPISEDRYKWEREGRAYFALQLHMAERNFCLIRIKHLIQIKSHLTERGIAGFSRPVASSTTTHKEAKNTKENTMSADFLSIDLRGFTPSQSLSNSVNNDDISSIRNALFMEMNDTHLSTVALRQAIAWTYSKHPNLFVAYEENAYSQGMEEESTKWNDHYYGMQEVYASSNFSLERIRHMVIVREHVFNIAQSGTCPATSSNSQPKNVRKGSAQNQERRSTGRRQQLSLMPENHVLKSLLLIGGVVVAIAVVILAVIV
jgi:hypothetical protein